MYQAYRDGAASGIGFIIGIPRDEVSIYQSFVGRAKYGDLAAAAAADLQDGHEGYDMPEEREKILEAWHERYVRSMYRSAEMLTEGGSPVHLLYWDEKPLIGKLGSGTVDVAASFLGNRDALLMYGNVMNENLAEILQGLLLKSLSKAGGGNNHRHNGLTHTKNTQKP